MRFLWIGIVFSDFCDRFRNCNTPGIEKTNSSYNAASMQVTIVRTLSCAKWTALSGRLQSCLEVCAFSANRNRFFRFSWTVWYSQYTKYRRNKYRLQCSINTGHNSSHFLRCKVNCVVRTFSIMSRIMCDSSESESIFRIFVICMKSAMDRVPKRKVLYREQRPRSPPWFALSRVQCELWYLNDFIVL